ncbi:MAG: DUF5716 family protein [Firmicutes bacterium]|nr:DUF5716 family protein [Bacillota bacterium]
MNLFSIIPERFFSVLASPLKEHYAAILFRIYDQYLLTSLGMERDVIVDVIVDYIEDKWSELGNSLEDEIREESLDNPANPRDRAAFVLRKLEQCGWLSTETYSNYKQFVTINDYAIKILDTLDKIRKNRQVEYQGYVYATYTLLYSEEVERQANLALEKAFEQTEQLLNGLKTLNQNIKRYIERVLAGKSPKDILKIHFEDYKHEIIDQSYHRLKTSDNVSRYRPKILKRINEWYNDPAWVSATAAMEVRRGRHAGRDEAEKVIYHRLDYIRQVYAGMDELLEEIDRRNSQYAGASFLQLKYILNSSRDVEGQITEVLKYLAGLRAEQGYRPDDDLPGGLESFFSLFSHGYIDYQSLYQAREAARNHLPGEFREFSGPGEEERREVLRKYREKLSRRMTRERVNRYIMDKLAGRQSIRAAELGIEEVEDFLKLIYAAAYSRSRLAGYRVDFKVNGTVTAGQRKFRFKDVVFTRRGAR